MGATDDVEVVISAERIAQAVEQLGAEIARDYAGRDLAIVAVLKGSFVFLADLVRAIDHDFTLDFVASEGVTLVEATGELGPTVAGRHVLLVQAVVHTGTTTRRVFEHLWAQKPRSVRVCTLLHRRAPDASDDDCEVQIDYRGFTIDEEPLVLGYGLDYAGLGRNLPFVGAKRGA